MYEDIYVICMIYYIWLNVLYPRSESALLSKKLYLSFIVGIQKTIHKQKKWRDRFSYWSKGCCIN